MTPHVLISAQPQTIIEDVREFVRNLGYTPHDHQLGSVPVVDIHSAEFAIICPSEQLEPAIAQTKRWRVELGDQYVPIIWLFDRASAEWSVAGFQAGADLCLSRPWEIELYRAQLRPLLRLRRLAERWATKQEEVRTVTERLQQSYDRTDREIHLARTIHRTMVPASLPEIRGIRFGIHHRPRSRAGGDFYDAWSIREDVEFFLADAVGAPGVTGSLFGLYVKLLITSATVRGEISPGELIHSVNRSLVKLDLADPPVVSLASVRVSPATGAVAFARAGLPHPIHRSAAGQIETWNSPGPYLGMSEAEYPTHYGQLEPGDKLLFATDGTTQFGNDGHPNLTVLLRSIETHGHEPVQPFVDAVANDLFQRMIPTDDFTLFAIERVPVSEPTL